MTDAKPSLARRIDDAIMPDSAAWWEASVVYKVMRRVQAMNEAKHGWQRTGDELEEMALAGLAPQLTKCVNLNVWTCTLRRDKLQGVYFPAITAPTAVNLAYRAWKEEDSDD